MNRLRSKLPHCTACTIICESPSCTLKWTQWKSVIQIQKQTILIIIVIKCTCVKTGSNDTITVWYGDGSVVYEQDKEYIILLSIAIVTLKSDCTSIYTNCYFWKLFLAMEMFTLSIFHFMDHINILVWCANISCYVHIYCIHSTESGWRYFIVACFFN